MVQTDLSNRGVILTGAAGRLGRIARPILERVGAQVFGVDLADVAGVDFSADLTSETDVARAFEAASKVLPQIDALVHVVGTWDMAPLHDTSIDHWRSMLAVNLDSVFLSFREAVRHMRRNQEGGRIVAVAARPGITRATAQQGPYAVTKAGVSRLVEAVTDEYAEAGISAAAIAPSMILFGDEEPGTGGAPADQIAAFCAYLAGEGGAQHAGATIPMYGNG